MHQEDTYQQMIDHFEEYTDVAGDHPLNLGSTTQPFNAFGLQTSLPPCTPHPLRPLPLGVRRNFHGRFLAAALFAYLLYTQQR